MKRPTSFAFGVVLAGMVIVLPAASVMAQSTIPAPTIVSLSPSSGSAGTSVTIGGSGFATTTDILFGGGGVAYGVVPQPAVFSCPMMLAGATTTVCGNFSQTLTFTVPSSVGAYCPPGKAVACPMYERLITPGIDAVEVVSDGTTSNAVDFTVTGTSTLQMPPISGSCSFTRTLRVGSTGADVTCLQEWLSGHLFYPQGFITGYFGSLTEQAVKRFQTQMQIVSSGSPATTGFGLVGPRTRTALTTEMAQ